MKNEKTITYIPIEEIYPHPDNPRKELGDLTELADSIKSKGIFQNLTVVPRAEGGYTAIIGHRRRAAAEIAGVTELPCVITEMSHKEQVATMLLENMQRSDLTVYEQAQGFQMMMDLGESIDSISDKTGFSKTTVRRRLKMAELDQKTLKSVSDRQISLDDFDKLSQIEDIDERNSLLSDIGTNNFAQRFMLALRKQKTTKILPWVREQIKSLHGNKIARSETYGGKYDTIKTCKLWDVEEGSELLTESQLKGVEKLFYYLDESWSDLGFYKLRPKAKPVKRPQSEIDREKYVAEQISKLEALHQDAYELRKGFVKNLSCNTKNVQNVLKGALTSAVLQSVSYVSTNYHNIYEILGVNRQNGYNSNIQREALEKLQTVNISDYAKIIYETFGDKPGLVMFSKSYDKSKYPTYSENMIIVEVYRWLTPLGYVMSDDERKLLDGTHELFVDKDNTDNG